MNKVNVQEEMLLQWQRNGFVKLSRYFTEEEANLISNYVHEIMVWPDVPDKWMRWYEKTLDDKKSICRIENYLDYHHKLEKIILKSSGIKGVVENLVGGSVRLFKDKINIKSPQGGGYVPHQDIYNADINKRQVHAIVLITVDKSDSHNGCIQFCGNGEHKNGIIKRDDNGIIIRDIYKNYAWQAVETSPGDIVIFDNYIPHYSEPNKSKTTRRAIFLAFQKLSSNGMTREQYYDFKREVCPAELPDADINNLRQSCFTMYNN